MLPDNHPQLYHIFFKFYIDREQNQVKKTSINNFQLYYTFREA